MIGKVIVVLAIILVGVFLLTHTNLFYHPQTPVSKGQEYYTTTNIQNVTYQFAIMSNASTTNYTVPLKLSYGNVTIKVMGHSVFNLTVEDNSTVIYSGIVNGYFSKSFMMGGDVKLVFSSKQGLEVNVTISDVLS
ncbi:hypothetical protein GFS03_06780 [Sulfolobus sp. E5-1-F]|uniref:hypothetical protein n=1 Tax=Sulfolobaceae TaxID=118883 RepID=UPI0012973742|nr:MULTISPECIES: hypothetical protein [unclassified Sulfolobus]QGA54298.1 hypothetical protein GFS03_06780 [Sulfolobus sp. E5-1-F]QGA69352.1 hypothetical protein GFS33_12190 [Sulfolobus sp. E11-6]